MSTDSGRRRTIMRRCLEIPCKAIQFWSDSGHFCAKPILGRFRKCQAKRPSLAWPQPLHAKVGQRCPKFALVTCRTTSVTGHTLHSRVPAKALIGELCTRRHREERECECSPQEILRPTPLRNSGHSQSSSPGIFIRDSFVAARKCLSGCRFLDLGRVISNECTPERGSTLGVFWLSIEY